MYGDVVPSATYPFNRAHAPCSTLVMDIEALARWGASILDPQTRIILWSLTEHIAPARTMNGANKNFDIAVDRIVARVKGLVAGDTAGLAIAEKPSPEIVAVEFD